VTGITTAAAIRRTTIMQRRMKTHVAMPQHLRRRRSGFSVDGESSEETVLPRARPDLVK